MSKKQEAFFEDGRLAWSFRALHGALRYTARMKFQDTGLDARLIDAVEALGFETPTPIQQSAIPPLLEGRDLVGSARTGSGKTAAFGLPMLHRLADGGRHVRGLVLAPTRELARQVTRALREFAAKLPVRVVCIYGGVPYDGQLRALRKGAQVVVGTPGRVLDLAERGKLRLDGVECFVLDEADEMLNLGFAEDIERVLGFLPDDRQFALLSATMPRPIQRIADQVLHDPVKLQVEDSDLMSDHIEQRWMKVPGRHKLDALVRVLTGEPRGTTLVFARTRKSVAQIADDLAKQGVPVDALHGDLSQSARERVLSRLRSGRLDVVIATDVASRGIDVRHLTHVINYDIPDDAESYTHRIGRTGRAGAHGVAITFVKHNELGRLRKFQRQTGADIDEVPVPSDAAIQRQQRVALDQSLRAALDDADEARAVIADLDLSAEDVAAAALHLLAEARGLPLTDDDELSEEPPDWSLRRSHRRSRPKGRHQGSGGHHGSDADECQLFLPAGKAQGVRPGDLVGALTGETGISGSAIGRIDVMKKVSFVAMSRQTAETVLASLDRIVLRGRSTPVLMARPRG